MNDSLDRHPVSDSAAINAAPPVLARVLAFAAIIVAGLCGGLIGYAVTDLQCADGCATASGVVGVLGAAGAAGGVGVVAVLTLRAMAEWNQKEIIERVRRQ